MDVAGRENESALDGDELDRRPGANRKPILILIFIPIVNYVIYPAIDKVFRLTPLRKIGIGLYITALSFVVIIWIQGQIDAGLKAEVLIGQLLAYVILTLGEADGFDHRTGIFLYPGAEFDEELGNGIVAVDCRFRRTFRRPRQ